MREYCAKIKEKRGFQKGAEENHYLHFGVREHAMAATLNDLFYHSSGLVINVLTHDSIGLGKDGPTHQPIETLASLRSIPNMLVIRPATATKPAAPTRWPRAVTSSKTATAPPI